LKFFSFFWQIRFYAPPRPRVRLNAFYKVLILTPLKQKFNNLGPIPTMASQHEEAKEHDGFRRMSGEDEMMFNNPAPFTAEVRLVLFISTCVRLQMLTSDLLYPRSVHGSSYFLFDLSLHLLVPPLTRVVLQRVHVSFSGLDNRFLIAESISSSVAIEKGSLAADLYAEALSDLDIFST